MPNGLRNTGSICFYNSLIQALFSCNRFKNTVFKMYNNVKYSPDVSLLKIANDIFTGNTLNQSLVDSFRVTFFDKIEKEKNFRTQGQQCSNEFFMFLIEFLDEEYYKIINNINNTINTINKTNQEFKNPLENLFKVTVEITFTCDKCKKSHKKIDNNIMYIFNNGMFSYTENLELNCEDMLCGGTTATVFYKVQSLSDIFVLYSYIPKKIIMPINIECDNKYKITSGIIHHGTPFGGHYYAYGYSGDRYYTFNDSSVSEFQIERSIIDPNIVMRFYEKQ